MFISKREYKFLKGTLTYLENRLNKTEKEIYSVHMTNGYGVNPTILGRIQAIEDHLGIETEAIYYPTYVDVKSRKTRKGKR